MTDKPQYSRAFEPLAATLQSIADRLETIEGMLREVLAAGKPIPQVVVISQPAPSTLFTTKEVAALLGLEVNTLDKWRTKKSNGPAWIYVGKGKRAVRYRRADVEAYMQANTTRPNDVNRDMDT